MTRESGRMYRCGALFGHAGCPTAVDEGEIVDLTHDLFWSLITNASLIVQLVLLGLVLISLSSWWVIGKKGRGIVDFRGGRRTSSRTIFGRGSIWPR